MTWTAEHTGDRATSRELVGRLDVLTRLEAVHAEVRAEHRLTTVFVEGAAGIGKSRVVAAFAELVRRDGGEVLVGRCVAQGEEILPYAPLVELLADVVRREGAAAVLRWAGPVGSELGRLVPSLARASGTPETTTASSSRLFQALCSLLENLSQRRPLVLVVEDLHWADRSTREMLALLSHQLRGDILLVLTLRTDEAPRDPGLVRFAAEVGRRGDHRITLQPLTREQQARQVSDILGVPPRRELLDDVYSRAEGNPFFAEELLVLGGAGDLPTTVRDLLLARLEALSPVTRQVLRAASVIGRRVPHRLLEAVSDVTGSRLDEALRPAVDGHVLVPADVAADGVAVGGAYQFRHALLQEAIAGSLLPGEISRLNRRVAQALTERPELAGRGTSAAGRVARHWYAAGDGERALTASVEAARAAKQALAFSESLAHYERAMRLLDTVDGGEALLDVSRAWLLWSAAEVAHLAAHPDRAAELVRLAIDVVDRDSPHLHGYLHERLGRYLWMAADGRGALAAYRRAVELVPPEPPTRWRAAVLSGYSQILMLSSRFAESLPLAQEAVAIAQQVDDGRSIEGHARCNLGVDLARLGHLDEAVRELKEARRIAEEQFDDVDDIARALVNLQSAYDGAGQLDRAAEVGLESIAVVEELGLQRRKGVWCRCETARALTLLGRHDEASRLLEEAFDLSPQGIDRVHSDIAAGQLMIRLGRIGTAREHLDRARREGVDLIDGQLIGPMYAALVEAAACAGDFDAARECADEGLARLSPEEDAAYAVPLFAAAVAALVEEQLATPRRAPDESDVYERAARWTQLIEDAIARTPAETPMASAHAAAARCETARLTGDASVDAWLDAATDWELLPEPYRASYARLRAAEAMLAAGSHRAEAERMLRLAWSTADRIGAARLRDLVESLATRARIRLDRPEPEIDNPHRLTRREHDVLALVAEGLSDREIGTRLFISHRTVERHVSNLLAKLAAQRRSQLTATAHRLGLVESPPPLSSSQASDAAPLG